MANPNDNLRRLYQNGLKHFSLPDFDTFQQDMKDEQKRRRFYTNMQEAYSLPDFDTFSQDIGAVAPPAPAPPAAQAQSQPQTTTATVKPITDTTAEQASVQQPVQTSAQPPQPQGWTPSPIQKQFFQFQMEQANARLKKQSEEAQQRMEGIMKGNKPGAFMGEREFNPATGEMETAYYTTQGERVPTSMQQRKANSDYHQWWENNTEAGQRSKEQRLQREFDDRLSRLWDRPERYNAAEQAWSAAESAYNSAVERNRENTNMMVTNFAMNSSDAVAFKQMETVDNFTDRLTTHDLDALMDNAWNNLGEEGQKALIDDCYQMLRYRNPGADGLVLYNQAKEFARQQSDLRMYNLAVEKNLPKSNLEYFMRKIGDMNLVTNIGKGIAVNRVKKTGDMAAYEAANEQYRQDGHKILDVTGMVAGFALDPTTWLSAGVGGAATRGSMWLGGRWLAGRGASAMVTKAATRQFATSMTGRIVGGIAGGAANFGTFEGIKEIENQFAHGGKVATMDENGNLLREGRYVNEGYSAGAVGGQALHGLIMGGAVGWLGPVSGNVSDQLVRATSSTLGKVATRAGVYTGATIAEGTIFSVPEWIEGERDGFDVWTDNMAMMVGFKTKHILKSASGVLGDLKASFDSPTNRRKNRLDFESRLRQRMDAPSDGGLAMSRDGRVTESLALTKDEAAELSKYGYGNLRNLVESAERTGNAKEGGLIAQNAPEIVSRLTDMVTDPRVSEAARAKMYYYATGRRLPMSTVMRGELIGDGNGGFIVESHGANGVITSRSFKNRKAADLELERIKRQTELNTIEIGERYQQTVDFESRLQEACRTVAAENGWDMVEVYRTCEEARRNHLRGGDKQFDEVQQNILRKVTDAMGEFEETGATDAIRGRINEKYGVDIDGAIRKEANRRTLQEQTAIDEYLHELIPDKAKEPNPVEDAQAEDITNQKLLTDESAGPAEGEPIDPRFDSSTDPTPDYDPHQPGGEQAPIGRAVMKYQDRPVEVLSGRVVMMEDGTMIDNKRSDASIVIRDLATGKVEMVSPEAILTYEEYAAPTAEEGEPIAADAVPAGDVQPQSQYTSGQIKIRNSNGTETRGVLTGFVDENGNHEYYVEGDLQHLHYASDHELDNILSEYMPDEPQPSAEQSQAAERVYPEGVNDTEAYDNGLEDGAANTDMSDEKLNSTIARFSDESEVSMLTDYGRGWLEGLKQEQQRRIQAAQSQQPEQTAPIEPTPASYTEPIPAPAEAPQGEVAMPTGVNPIGTIAIPQHDGSTRTFTVGKNAEGENVVIDDRGFIWAHDGNGNVLQPYYPGANVPTWSDEQLAKLGEVQPANEQPGTVPNQPEIVPNSGETPQNPTENAVSPAESVPNPAAPVENVQETPATTPLQRIPRDAKGEPIFEQAEDPEHGWDALVEFADGDAATAKEIADTMAEEKRKAYEKAQKQKPKGKTPTEILASKKAISAELVQAEQEYNLWQQMANVEQRRQDAIRAQQEAEARQRAAERAEAEKAEREAREEAARLEREALEGIPEWHLDTPENARKRGVRRFSGQMFTRQEPVHGVVGKEVEVKFSQKDLPKGHLAVIEAPQLQPSHIQGQRNPMFFIEEAQPKNRAEAVSMFAAKEMAEGIRPQEITGSATAYTGAPTVNTRGEVLQGNNRSDALRYLWENKLPEQQQTYKQYLIDNAEQFGLDPEAVNAIQQPVLVNMLDVDDAEAIRLGQMTAQDTESGGVERIKPKNVTQRLGDDMRSFANLLLQSGDEEASFGQLVDRNGTEVLKWMAHKGAITNTQYQSAFDSKGNLTAEAKNDLQKVLYQAVFKGGSQQLEEMFDALPAKAQRAILSTAFRDMDSPVAGKMLPEIQASIAAYHQLMHDPAFAAAGKMEEALRAVEGFKRLILLDDRFEQYMPADDFSNFALHLAAMYKASDMSQSTIAGYFNQMYDLAQGKKAATLFEEANTTEYPLADVIKQVLNIDYKPAKNGNNNVTNGGVDVALRNQDGQRGELRGNEPPASGEQNPTGTEPSDRGAGTEDVGNGQGDSLGAIGNRGLKDFFGPVYTEFQGKGNEAEAHLRETCEGVAKGALVYPGISPIDLAWGDKKAGYMKIVIKHPEVVGRLQEILSQCNITKQSDNRIVFESDTHKMIVSKMKGATPTDNWLLSAYEKKEKSVSASSSDIETEPGGMRNGTATPQNGLSSDRKVNNSASEKQVVGQEGSVQPSDNKREQTVQTAVKVACAQVNTEPTPAQAEAGNYKKGHVTIGEFDITIENPAGSVRKGVDADGREWSNTMANTYGYIKGTEGVDGDHIDVFLHSDMDQWNGRKVFVVDQTNTDGSFDEHKVMLGFHDKDEAMTAYLANYDKTWADTHPGLRISETNIEDFNKWVQSSHRKTKPFADYTTVGKVVDDAPVKAEPQQPEPSEAPAQPAATIEGEDYKIESKPYTNKQGKTLDTYLVTFDRDFSKEELSALRAKAKALKGWYDRESKGWMLRSSDDAKAFAEDVTGKSEDEVADEAPLSMADMEKPKPAAKPKKAESLMSDRGTTGGPLSDTGIVEAALGRKYRHENGNNYLVIAKKITKDGVKVTRIDRGGSYDAYISVPELADALSNGNWHPAEENPMKQVDVEGVFDALKTKGETKLSDHAKPVEAPKPKKRRWISDEDADEFDSLRKDLRSHFGKDGDIVQEAGAEYGKPKPKQMDAEVLRMGTRMTYLMMKGGLRSFSDYCEAMKDELPDIFDEMRPHLKSLYAAAQNMEEVIELGWDEEMDDRKTVKAFDVYNFDKPGAKDIIATAQHAVDENASQQQTDQIIQTLKDQRNEQRKKEADETSADTETIIDKAETTASQVESKLEAANSEEDAEGLSRILDKELEEVNKQLALLGYYEADPVDKDFNESYGYMRNAERKAVQDAHRLATQLAADLGITIDPKDKVRKAKYGFGSKIARSNVAPAGGEVYITLPLAEGRELSIWLSLDKNEPWREGGRADRTDEDLMLTGIMYRIENTGKGSMDRYESSNHNTRPTIPYDELLSDIRRLVRSYLPDETVKPATPLSPQPGEDMVDVAKRVAADKEPKAPAVESQLAISDLFGGLFDEQPLSGQPKPIGKGAFGHIYNQFKRRVKEAVAFLMIKRDGDILGVFSRDGYGDIDFVWGDKNGGFAHILDKHVGAGKSFATAEEAAQEIDRIIKYGEIAFENGDKLVFKDGTKLVTVRKNLRNRGKKIADKNWVLTAYDNSGADNASAISNVDSTQAAPTGTPKSNSKGNDKSINNKGNEKTDVQPGTEETGRGRQQPRPNEQMGTGAEHENERTDGGRMAQRRGEHSVSDSDRGAGVSGLHKSERGVSARRTPDNTRTPAVPKNTRNNHAERGTDYAPKGEKARIDANIAALELAKKLLASGATATPQEMAILRRYSGWGGLGAAFNEGNAWAPNPVNKRLREALTPEEYQAAVMSRNSAYYTPAAVIDAMWDVAKALGFKGGNIVEGSAGIGNIIGLMPTDISERSNIHAVEIDPTTGGILSLLYPDAQVEVQGFEQTRIANGSVDLAITNVPFVTDLHVKDESGDSDLSKKFRDIHDFCIAKNVRKLREGGIGIFITSSGTLDKSQKLRNWLVGDKEGNVDVVGVFRMNNQTFGGTAATSDIIVVRKRVNGRKSANAIDVSTVTPARTATFTDARGKTKDLPLYVNRYFIEHPEHMGGEMFFGFEQGDTYRPTSIGLFPTRTANQSARMAAWVQHLADMDWSKEQGKAVAEQTSHINEALGEGVKEGSMVLNSEGQLCTARQGRAVPIISPQSDKGKPQKTDEERLKSFQTKKIKGRTKQECFKDYTEIKSALADVLKYQTEHDDDAGLQPLLDRLNRAYDTFVQRYGNLNKNSNLAWLRNDVDFSSIVALETYSEKGNMDGTKVKTYGKTDIFSHRVVEKEIEPSPKNVKDGIIASIYKYSRIDTEYLATQLGKSQDDVKQEIAGSGLGFMDPTTGQMEVSYEYLSGNVREKLRQAREANEAAGGTYDANIKALEAVVPMNIPAHLIEFALGSSWIEPQLYERYVKERTELDVKLTNAGGTWHMSEPWNTDKPKNTEMGVRSEAFGILIPGHKLIEAALTNKTITVSRKVKDSDGGSHTETDHAATTACATKVDEIRQDFKDWAREQMQNDPALSMRMEEKYNEKFNNSVPKSIPDEFVPEHFGGAATTVGGIPFKLRPHQAKAVIRATTQPVLLAHEVGTGKTYTLITTAMEMRRLGTARKPMIVVQNATVGQFVASAKALYPNAKILTLEDADRNAEGRKNFYAKIRYNDWDMIVVPQSVFERIPDSIERQTQFIQDKIEEKMLVLEQMKEADPDGRSMIVHAAEREISRLEDEMSQLASGEEPTSGKKKKDAKKAAITRQNAEVKARELLDRATDDVEDFDSMGIDAILVDEAHEYKHLGFATAMQRGVKGVDPSPSKKSQGVFLKAQAVLEKTGGKNVVFATGTPISNTAAEIWTFMRYLIPADVMKEYDIYYFDDFVRNFGNLQQMLEFKTDGKYDEVNRFAGYVNLPELVRIWSTVADTVLTREAGGVSDKIPQMEGGKAQDIFLPQTRALRSIMKFVKDELKRYEDMTGKEKKENSHIPVVMYGIAKAAAVDARLVLAGAEDDPNSKTNEAVRQTLRTLEETKDYKGTVAIFADNYQRKNHETEKVEFNLYDDIRKKLIAAGVPAEHIVVMRPGMKVNKKLEIFEKVNSGEVRVVMGSTFTLGTGVNIQERLHTLIHLDAPNRPMDYTQRNGRILRQGNLHNTWGLPVRVLRFGVEDSLDVTAYQRLKTKGAIADSIMNGKQLMANSMENRYLEEDQDLFGDITAQLSGSEYAMLKNQIEKEVRKLRAAEKNWKADQTYIHNRKRQITGQNREAEKRIADNQSYLAKVEAATIGDITVGKLSFPSVDAMEDFFTEQNKKKAAMQEQVRTSGYSSRPATSDITISVGGFDFKIHTEITKEMKHQQGDLFATAPAKMTYSCPELGIDAMPVKGNSIKNAVTNIMDNVVSGKNFRERISHAENYLERNNAEFEAISKRDGQPFKDAEALAKAEEKLEEYEELMKAELAAKEAKYAEMDKEVEAASGVEFTEEENEETAGEPVSEYSTENSNFASSYETKDGKTVRYTSESRESYDGLFDYDFSGENRGSDAVGSRAGFDILQRERSAVLAATHGDRLNRKTGEYCNVERVFTESGSFKFTSGEKIESADDVAFIFSALEDAAVEHTFAVYVKDGVPTVVELGMGSFNASIANNGPAYLAYTRIKPDEVYFVHNHPSGNLKCSAPDVRLLKQLQEMFNVPVYGIIINLKTGKYGTFDTDNNMGVGDKRIPEKEYPLTLHKLDKQIFAPDYDPMVLPMVRGSHDVASFVNSHRMGDRAKMSFLIISQSGGIVGNIHMPYKQVSPENVEKMAQYISERVIQFGGMSAIVYGDFSGENNHKSLQVLRERMKQLGGVNLLDVMRIEGNFSFSANDEGILYEPDSEYGAEPLYNEREDGYYEAIHARAVAERGIVIPGLNERQVYVVEVERHDFSGTGKQAIEKARNWANSHLVGEHLYHHGKKDEFQYDIDTAAIGKYLSASSTKGSDNLGIHLACLKSLPEIIDNSIEVEIHADYAKAGGKRSAENRVQNPDILIHRYYGAVRIDGKLYRVKTTIKETRQGVISPYNYQVTELELLISGSETSDALSNSNRIGVAKLLKGVEKSYDSGKKLLEESEDVPRSRQWWAKTINGNHHYRKGDGIGAYSDEEVSYAGNPILITLGGNRFSKRQQAKFAAAERERMAARIRELAERLHLEDVEIVTELSNLEGPRAKAKGFYNKRTGKITIVIPNNLSTIDAEQTLLHEAVAHHGLRKLFGERFDTFLDNVYEAADESIRRKIAEMAAQNGWNFRTAIEEYLAGLAEDIDFEAAKREAGWWTRIKQLFIDMLETIGFKGFRDKTGIVLTDNELRYILWRSYENLTEPGQQRSILGEAADIAKQAELKVGNYAEGGIEAEYATESQDVKAINDKFNMQLRRWAEGVMQPEEVISLGAPMGVMRGFLPDIPILLRQKVLTKSRKKHGLTARDMENLPQALAEPIFVFKSNSETISVLTMLKTPKGDNLFVAIELEKDLHMGGRNMVVNDILTIHGREIENVVLPINQNGTLVWADKKKGLAWLHSTKSKSQAITNQDLEDAANIVKSFENPTVEEEELFRPGDFTPRDRVLARATYERMVSSGRYQFTEAMQDSMLGLKKLYESISGKGTRMETVPGFENAYTYENRMSGTNNGEQHEYFIRYMQPLLKEIGKIAGASNRKRRELTDYMMAKHGLERNAYMRNEAAANGEDTDRDFAGLIGLTGETDWKSAEATAQQWVDDYESTVDTTALWQTVNDATKATLEKVYLSGIISKETYEKILGMYQYYIPLRGWDETTSEQVYGYLTSKDGPLGGSIMKKAEGRSSMADDPIATIAMMADDAIRQGNRNLMKQRFLNFILNHPSDVVSVHDVWLKYDDVADEWCPVFADVEVTDTADEVDQKVEAFEQRMEALRQVEPDKYKKGSEAQNIPYKVVKGNLREHQVLIKRNGRTFVATINGNPRAAQALNGLTNPDVDQNGVVGNMLKLGEWTNRQLSAFYTTRNPDFVVSNFLRDMLYSNCMTWVKESPRYAMRFHKNFGKFSPISPRRFLRFRKGLKGGTIYSIGMLLRKWEKGTLDMNDKYEKMFYQFMKNGGETGYTNVRDIEGHKKAVAAELKKQGNLGRKAWSALGMQLDLLNRSVENCARFAAFVTSREFGRSIDRAIYDAKEISVNFNKKGSGGKMVNANGQTKLGKFGEYLGGGGRIAFVFWNAGIQGMTNFGRQAKRHPAKFIAGATAMFALGFVIPMLAQMLGGGDEDDDDKNAYYNLPEYIRRSNICFRAGRQWILIPLPIEFRPMYGMGELAYGVISNNERYSNKELAYQIIALVSQTMPLDMLEGGGGFSPFIPSAFKPAIEAYVMNKSWTGLPIYKDTPFNKHDPEWTKAYASADKHLVDFAKWLNETSGGDDYKKGAIDINPAKVEYMLNGTFGGMFSFPNKLIKTGETIVGDRDFEWKNIPVANRLIKSGDERTAHRKLRDEYYRYLEEYEETGRLLRKYRNAADGGALEYAQKVSYLENSEEALRWLIFDSFKEEIDERQKAASESDGLERKGAEAEMYAAMRQAVDALHSPTGYLQGLYDSGQLSDETVAYLKKHHGIVLKRAQ